MHPALPASQRTPCPDGGDYALATTGEWYSWADAMALDLDAQGQAVNGDQQPYDLVSRREWER
jgi:hypothetical protein